MASFGNISGACALLLVALTAVNGMHHMPNAKWMADTTVSNDGKSITFVITGVNVTGWVGVGVNGNGTMTGADLFIGGVLANGTAYGKDYTGREGTSPIEDATDKQNWNIIVNGTSEVNGTTKLTVTRLLKTTDTGDFEIKNENQYLLWSYGADDNVAMKHADKGAISVNLLSTSGSGASTTSAAILALVSTLLAAFMRQ